MDSWHLLIPSGRLFIDFASIGGLFLLAMLIRRRVPVLQNYLVPVNLIAGFLGLIAGNSVLGIIDFESERMGTYVYHLLALTFIAVSLHTGSKKLEMSFVKTGFLLVTTYVIQGVLGIVVALAIKDTFFPDLFPGFGLMLPLSFGMGPGIAFSISRNWEQFGFTDGGIAGLTLATIGYAWAYVGGIILLRWGIRNNKTGHFVDGLNLPEHFKKGYYEQKDQVSAGKGTTPTEVIEALTVHFAVVGFVYLVTIWVCNALENVLVSIGAEKEVTTLWSFHFLIGSLCALGVRKIIDFLGLDKFLDSDILIRVANLFVDYMIAASIIAISLSVAMYYLLPLLVVSTLGGILTFVVVNWLTYKYFDVNPFERLIAFYGNSTGTIQSGLVLLRVLDPRYDSGAADNLVYGSGVALVLGFPLLVLINAPVNSFNNELWSYWAIAGLLLIYWIMLLLLGFRVAKGTNS
jgi:ESS family glutamate:Na+ symporter